MKYTIALIVFASAVFGQATGYIESYHQVKSGAYENQVNYWLQGPIQGKIGYFGWALTSKGWSEGYAGLNYSPIKGVEVGAGAGVETNKSPARLGTYASVSRGRLFAIGIYENGGSGYWDRAYGNYTLYKHEWFSVGVGPMHQAFCGFGPRYQIGIGKATVWGNFLAKEGSQTAMLALQWNF